MTTSIRISNTDLFSKDAIWPRNVGLAISKIPIRKQDGYTTAMIEKFARELKNVVVKNGIVFLICYAPTEDKARPFEVARAMTKAGFKHIDNIVVKKTWHAGKRSEANLVNSHEYVMYFVKGNTWSIDRTPIHIYLNDENSVDKCCGNTWEVNTGSLGESVSIDLAELLIRLPALLPGSLVFDPFMSNSATFLAASKLGHNFVGFEKNLKKSKKYEEILNTIKGV